MESVGTRLSPDLLPFFATPSFRKEKKVSQIKDRPIETCKEEVMATWKSPRYSSCHSFRAWKEKIETQGWGTMLR